LKKEIEDDYRRWKDLSCSGIGRISIVKMAIIPKAIYICNKIPFKIPMTFITGTGKSPLKFTWKQKRQLIPKAIMRKKSNAGGVTISNSKLYYRAIAIAIKTAWYHHKNRHEEEWNTIENPDINPCNFSHQFFLKAPRTYDGEKAACSTNVAGKTGNRPTED
jgi:hypothetical protein